MYQTIGADEFSRLKKIKVIDVRETQEHAYGYIKEAHLMPLNTIPSQLHNLSKEDTYYVVCHSGARSSFACQYLSNQGYGVVNVMGGMSAYKGDLEYEM